VTAEPPFEAGADQANVTLPLPAFAEFKLGAAGAVLAAFWTVMVAVEVVVLPA
jgi:hypothetical protein